MANKTIHYRLCGLDYVYLIVPVLKLKSGEEMIDLPMGVIDKGIAFKIIEDRVPIRGAEVMFLRKALGLSLKDWANKFGLSAAGVLKWERARDKRLAPVNEAAVRAFCAELLGVVFEGTWSELIADNKTPKKVSVKLPLAA
jgi:hypothetical protein